jgi:anti-anti-sigma factor
MIVDLRQVHAIDAAGLGLLVELRCRTLENDGEFALANPSPWVRRIMALTNLESVLQLEDGTGLELAHCDERAMTA